MVILTIDLGDALQLAANAVVTLGGFYGFWYYLRRKLHQPPK